MVIVDNRDFIKKAMEDHQMNLYDFHDSLQVFSLDAFSKLSLTRRMDVLLIDTQTVMDDPRMFEAARPLLNTFQGTYFFHDEKNLTARKWVEEQASFLPKIIGECALPMNNMGWTLFANQLQFFWTLLQDQRMLQKHMVEFSQELDHALQTAETEMIRAKKIHETLIPKRMIEIKGVSFFHKYASGDSGGAEFTDLLQSAHKSWQVLVSSESYLISSSLMGILNSYKDKDFNPAEFLADAKADIAAINGPKKKKAETSVLVIELDFSSLSLRTFGESKTEFCSQFKGKISLGADKEYKLSKGEKLIVLSPGFLFNWKESSQKQDIHSFIKSHQELNQQDLMTELYFQIRQDKGSQFLKRDATVVMMEVNRHGIHQV